MLNKFQGRLIWLCLLYSTGSKRLSNCKGGIRKINKREPKEKKRQKNLILKNNNFPIFREYLDFIFFRTGRVYNSDHWGFSCSYSFASKSVFELWEHCLPAEGNHLNHLYYHRGLFIEITNFSKIFLRVFFLSPWMVHQNENLFLTDFQDWTTRINPK